MQKHWPSIPAVFGRLRFCLAAIFLLFIFQALAAQAADITPNAFLDVIADDGMCTLREAITAANTDTPSGINPGECPAGSGDDRIILSAGAYQLTIVSTNEDNNADGDLDIKSNLELVGAGSGSTIIDGNGATIGDRAVHVTGSYTVSFYQVKIINGRSPAGADGGGIFNQGALTVSNCEISGNGTLDGGTGSPGQNAGWGGGIYNGGTLVMSECLVSGNFTGNGGDGLAGGDAGGDGGRGGGISTFYGTLTLTNCTISGNTTGNGGNGLTGGNAGSGGLGGGVFAYEAGNRTITGCTITGNTCGTAGTGAGAPNNGDGGGYGTYGGTHNFTNCTISGNNTGANPADGGGIMGSWNSNITVVDSTIVSNTASSSGGGFSTGDGSAVFNVRNSIVANNTAGVSGDDCYTLFINLTSQGYNLIKSTASCTITGNVSGNKYGQDPVLGALTDNGGSTWTHALLAGSPALDAGHPTLYSATDQRGISRPQGAGADMGAYELEQSSAPVTQTMTFSGGTTSSQYVSYAVAVRKDDQSPPSVLGIPVSSYSTTMMRIGCWFPELGYYLEYPFMQSEQCQPGKAAWYLFRFPRTIIINGYTPWTVPDPISGGQACKVDLDPGWNQVGNPFVHPIYASKITYVSNGQRADLYIWTGSGYGIVPASGTVGPGWGGWIHSDFDQEVRFNDEVAPMPDEDRKNLLKPDEDSSGPPYPPGWGTGSGTAGGGGGGGGGGGCFASAVNVD